MVKQRKWIAMLCCMLMFIFSSYGLWRELTPFLAQPVSDMRVGNDLAPGDLEFGLSSYSKMLVMTDCFRIVRTYGGLDMADEMVRNAVSNCSDRAADVVATTPTDSFAWLVRAAASALLLAKDDLNVSLQNSQLTGPNEQWIARFRVNLAESNLTHLTARTLEAEKADLRLLVSSEKGVLLIAKRYISNPDFRSRITAIVEQMPQDRQIVFLRTVKRSMGNG
jgi:hypothetical protein